MSEVKIVGRDARTDQTIAVWADKGIITRIENTKAETDLYLSAGFIDLQVNGYAGFDLNAENISAKTMIGLVDVMLVHGVTCFAPTLITAPEDRICRNLRVIAGAYKNNGKVAASVPFVHVEGPHISPLDGYRGAHPASAVRPPSLTEFDRWQDAADGLIGMVTLSPHYEESVEYIAALVQRGTHAAIGHTHASYEQIRRAVDAGASLATHLGNGIAQEIPRHSNPLFAQLADDRLTATFIADGHHLPSHVLKVMIRAKGPERCLLVSDAVALAGMDAGVYTAAVGGQVELRADGRLSVFGTEFLAGATAPLTKCIGNVVRTTATSLKDALAMVTVNPGRFTKGRGHLAVGSRADLIRFRWSDEVLIEDVWLAGESVHQAQHASRKFSPAPSIGPI
jgi:N-acetylglucosamine-6-phosphate deacetylase